MFVKAFFLLTLAAIAMSAPVDDLLVGPVDAQQEWTNWKKTHNKSYGTPDEESKRFQLFQDNLNKIVEHNKKYQAGEVTWSQGLNQFADLTQEEFANTYLGARPSKNVSGLAGFH